MSSTDLSRLIETANEHEERIRELEAIIDRMPTPATFNDLLLRVVALEQFGSERKVDNEKAS